MTPSEQSCGSKSVTTTWTQEEIDCALYRCAGDGNTLACQILLDQGAHINAKTSTIRTTALHAAAANGSIETCAMLLKRGADLEARSISGGTPLGMAVLKKNRDTALWLITQGANSKNKLIDEYYAVTAPMTIGQLSLFGMTPLEAAVRLKDGELVSQSITNLRASLLSVDADLLKRLIKHARATHSEEIAGMLQAFSAVSNMEAAIRGASTHDHGSRCARVTRACP